MQTIFLNNNFQKIFSEKFISLISIPNDFIYLEKNMLSISFNLDIKDIIDSQCWNETEAFEIISEFEQNFLNLKNYFLNDFEIIYFTYLHEYTVTIWHYSEGRLYNNTGWIGDFCKECKEIEDTDERENAQSIFVDDNYLDLKNGYPSDELVNELRNGLYEL